MDRLGSELDRELRRFGAHGAMPAIVSAWPAAVGPEIARNAWPARVTRDRVLHVHTSSSAWSFELGHLEATVLERLAETLGEDTPTSLKFAPGPIPEPIPDPTPDGVSTPIAPASDVVAEAEAMAAGIRDDDLRQYVARAIAMSLERARSDRRF